MNESKKMREVDMKQVVLDVLKNNHTQKIKFTYTGETGARYRIFPNDFKTVALNIEYGNIDVQQGGAPAGKARYSIKKHGNSQANTFYIGKNNGSPNVFQSLLVHESVHAIYDLKGITMPWLDNEAIAYVAQGFYILSAGEDGGLSEQAFLGLEVAKQYQNGGGDSFWEDALRQSLQNDPLYSQYINGNFVGDG
jgi:hypothetical protein